MSVTIRDVAKFCGVSVSTVSRVLNGYTDISEETAGRVFAAIKKLDYVPNNTARMLTRKNTRIIGLTIPDIKDPFFSENASGAEKLLQENGYQIFYGNMERSAEKLLNFLEQARQMRFDGLIITPDEWTGELLDTIRKISMPEMSMPPCAATSICWRPIRAPTATARCSSFRSPRPDSGRARFTCAFGRF